MKKIITVLMMAFLPAIAFAAGGSGPALDKANVDLSNKAALQRGAKMFVNYCMNCHSAKYVRYNKFVEDLGMSEEQVRENLMFGATKLGQPMTIAMDPVQASGWFGTAPPDLSLIVRAKRNGEDWLYTYLRTFYIDESRPFGMNNLVFDKVGMPHVLWELQGTQKAIFKEEKDAEGNVKMVFDRFEQVTPGSMNQQEYDQAVRDLVTFLAYTAEPVKLERQRIGLFVLLFLVLFFIVAYAMKKEFWKDVH